MVKFHEAEVRLFRNIFICKRCKSKIRASSMKVISGEIRCRKCGGKALRNIKKK